LSQFDLTTPGGRLEAYWSFLWTDHAYFRLAFQNAHWLSPEMVRANQPWPFQLKAWKAKGIRTVLSLRDQPQKAHHVLEADACERLGLKLVEFVLASREAPTREQVLGAKALFETLEYPCLMHCKSGADRAGVMSVLYAHFRLGQPIEEAARQLSFRYGHIRHGETGVLDFVFQRYLDEAKVTGDRFEDWVGRPEYDIDRVKADFTSQWWGTLLTERLLRRE
jgi:protein tyrosine/serine phosphatase